MSDTLEQQFRSYRAESSEAHNRQITDFAEAENLSISLYQHDGKNLLLLHDRDVDGLPDEKARVFLDTHSRIKKGGIYNNCYFIAALATYTKITDGALHSQEGTSDFVGYANHSLNWMKQSDGNILAVDFTAGDDIDHEQGNFSVLVIKSKNMEELLSRLGKLYGGKWEVIPNDQTFDTYKTEYPDNDQERQEALMRQEQRWTKNK